MNRALLVVICDFMVLSMMSMSDFATHANLNSPLGADGANHAILDASLSRTLLEELKLRQARIEEEFMQAVDDAIKGREEDQLKLETLSTELAASRAQIKYLTQRLALTPEEIGELSTEALRKLWEDEAKSRELAQIRYETITSEVQFLRTNTREQGAELRQTAESLAVEKEKNIAAGKRIDELSARNRQQEEDIAARNKAIAEKDAIIVERDSTLRSREEELNTERRRYEELATDMGTVKNEAARVAEQLADVTGELTEQKEKLAVSSAQLEYAKGQLEASISENEATRILLAEARSQLEAEKRRARAEAEEAMRREAELQRNIAVIQRDYTQTVAELSKMKSERDNAQRQRDNYKDAMDTAVNAVRETANQNKVLTEQIKEAEAKNLNIVQPRYKETVNTVSFALREKRLLVDYQEKREFFWPEIILDGRRFVIGDLRALTGYDSNIYSEQITELAITAAPTGTPGTPVISVSAPAADRRVALLEVADSGKTPLRPITREELQKRGLNDLYVFKARSNGESFLLGDRGILDLSSQSSVLRVRNRRRGRDAAAYAVEPGDFILAREGYFVGMAVGLTGRDASGDDEALIFVFPSGDALDGALNIPVTKTGEFYSKFASTMSAMQNNWKIFDSGVEQ